MPTLCFDPTLGVCRRHAPKSRYKFVRSQSGRGVGMRWACTTRRRRALAEAAHLGCRNDQYLRDERRRRRCRYVAEIWQWSSCRRPPTLASTRTTRPTTHPAAVAGQDGHRPFWRISATVSASPTARLLRGCGRAGTQNDRLGESSPTVRSTCPEHSYTRVCTHV